MRPCLKLLGCLLFWMLARPQFAQQRTVDERFFVDQVYPILEKAECRMCHNDNGVSLATRLKFSPSEARTEAIEIFGLKLSALVDRQNVAQSLLPNKPTMRIPHTGGERIPKGSAEEETLKAWVRILYHRRREAGGECVSARRRPKADPVQTGSANDRTCRNRFIRQFGRSGGLLTARAEWYSARHPEPLKESIRRLQAYAEAGADILYAPGPGKREDIQDIVTALTPKPVNLLMSANTGLRVSDLAELGVRRVSVGSALARAAWSGFIHAAKAIAEEGAFTGFDGSIPFDELNSFFREDRKRSQEGR